MPSLSIAESLTQLQGGSFHLFVDGDLFKAVLVFSRLTAEPEPVEEPEVWEVRNIEEAESPVVTVYFAQENVQTEENAEEEAFEREVCEEVLSEDISE